MLADYGSDNNCWVVAYGLRDAGFEVIYTGLHQTPKETATAAVQEDIDVVGLSILSGAHLNLSRTVIEELKALGGEDIIVIIGGVIPDVDIAKLKDMGLSEVFTSGSSIQEIAQFIHSAIT